MGSVKKANVNETESQPGLKNWKKNSAAAK